MFLGRTSARNLKLNLCCKGSTVQLTNPIVINEGNGYSWQGMFCQTLWKIELCILCPVHFMADLLNRVHIKAESDSSTRNDFFFLGLFQTYILDELTLTRGGSSPEDSDIFTARIRRLSEVMFSALCFCPQEGANVFLVLGCIGNICYVRWGPDTPVLDFWWHLSYVSKSVWTLWLTCFFLRARLMSQTHFSVWHPLTSWWPAWLVDLFFWIHYQKEMLIQI